MLGSDEGRASLAGRLPIENKIKVPENGRALVPSLKPDPMQSFGTFVIGPHNEFAFKAARRLAAGGEMESRALYIHGAHGYGKTHLLHAIHLEAQGAKAMFLRAEDFMRRFVVSMRTRTLCFFWEELGVPGILLLDDLHRISHYEATTKDLLRIMRAVLDHGGRLVVTADRPLTELQLPEEFRTWLEQALTTRLAALDEGTRLAILKAKMAQVGERRPRALLPESVLVRIARESQMSPQELLGVLAKLSTYADLTGKPVTAEVVEEILGVGAVAGSKRVTIEEIQKRTVGYYNLDLREFHSARRARVVARPRQVAMFLARELTKCSLPDIGRRFGGRDHTTVLHACRRIEDLCKGDPCFATEVAFLRESLQ